MKFLSRLFEILSIVLLFFYIPVLFCVVVFGKHLDYWLPAKIATRLPNQVLFILALVGLGVCIFLFWKFGNKKLSSQVNWAINCLLALLFLALYFLNVFIAKEIVFHLPWDINIVSGVAYLVAKEREVGGFYYLSMYSNNIPISYILGRLYRKAMEMQDYPYLYDFIWIQVNCALISIAGFFSCLTVKKITKSLMPVVTVLALYLVLVGISPWKIAPYTDTYGLIFPIMCIYFYICYRQTSHIWCKYLYILLSVVAGMLGGFIKPSLYIIVIALLATEVICLLMDYKKRWRYVLAEIGIIAVLAWGSNAYLGYIIDDMGLEFNKEIEAGWQHYFYMGLNEETTGGYNSGDTAIFGEFQTSRSDRIHAELERAGERLKNRGFFGSIYFYLRKLVMTFNDGVFGWRTEVWIYDYYPDTIASNTPFTQRLRDIFWGNDVGYDVGGYNTLCQLAWIFSILGIPGICLCKDQKREEYGILVICFLGIFFYQMLFEARARYLFVFLPVLLSIAVCGIQQFTCYIVPAIQKRKTESR